MAEQVGEEKRSDVVRRSASVDWQLGIAGKTKLSKPVRRHGQVADSLTRRDRSTLAASRSRMVNRDNIARCCFACNASKGAKELRGRLDSECCRCHGITEDSVAEVVRRALVHRPSPPAED
jgi:hypothetical protein